MNPFLPQVAEIVERVRETERIFTLRLRFKDAGRRGSFQFAPGQFNMVYAFGAGEVPISIVSDPSDPVFLDHTIREVGMVTQALGRLKKGDAVGLRGPFGNGWPLEEAKGRDILVITGGLGCAPVVSVIQYLMARRKEYGRIKILHGVKGPKDHIYRNRFAQWAKIPDTEVWLTSDRRAKGWKYRIGVVTNLVEGIEIAPQRTVAMMCGPEAMMRFALRGLLEKGMTPENLFLSLERNMKCALGFCGHCLYGPAFICKDGPVLRYDRIQNFFPLREI